MRQQHAARHDEIPSAAREEDLVLLRIPHVERVLRRLHATALPKGPKGWISALGVVVMLLVVSAQLRAMRS